MSALVKPLAAPSQPDFSDATELDQRVSLSYTVANTGGAPISRYEVQQSLDGGVTFTPSTVDRRGGLAATTLSNGSPYVFRVRAWNAVGPSPWSTATSTLRPYDTITAPQVAATATPTGAHVEWTPVPSTASRTVTGYRVFDATSGVVLCETSADQARTCSLPSPDGTTTTVRVAAIAVDLGGTQRNGFQSLSQTATARITASVQVTPPSVRAVAGDEQLTVVFSPTLLRPGMDRPTGYRAYVNGVLGCQTPATAAPLCVVPNLQNGTTYQVVAVAYAADVESVPAKPVSAVPVPWTSTAPYGATATVTPTGVMVSAYAPKTSGVKGFLIARNGVLLATTTKPQLLDLGRSRVSGTWQYEITPVGPKGRLGVSTVVEISVAVPAAPTVTVACTGKGKVVLTASLAAAVADGDKWHVLRNGRVIAVVPALAEGSSLELPPQTPGRFSYQVVLVTASGVSDPSAPATVTVM